MRGTLARSRSILAVSWRGVLGVVVISGALLLCVGLSPAGAASSRADFVGSSADGARVFFETTDQFVAADNDGLRDVYERSGGVTMLVSAPGVGASGLPVLAFFVGSSVDGTRVFFVTAEKLVAADTDGLFDVYQRSAGATTLVSAPGVGASGLPADVLFSGASADGSRVFFDTAEKLVTADADDRDDVYEHSAGATTLVSAAGVGASGAPADAFFGGSSADGAGVFFHTAENLVAADTDGLLDVYERSAGATTLVSATGAGASGGPAVAFFRGSSADGTKVFFETAEQLVGDDADALITDVYERSAGTTTLVSAPAGASVVPRDAAFSGSSADGARVFFVTAELTSSDGDNLDDVYERSAGATTLVSAPGIGASGAAAAVTFGGSSGDGGRVFFVTAQNLVAADTDGLLDVYERSAGTTTLVSAPGIGASGLSRDVSFKAASGDGAKVFFQTSENLVAADTDGLLDVYERSAGATTLVSAPGAGASGTPNDVHFYGSSTDGDRVFLQTVERLVAADTDADFDVYERSAGTTTLLTPAPPRTLTVTTSGAGSGTVTGPGIDCGGAGHVDCTQTVADGTTIQLTATAAAGSSFAAYTGGGCAPAAPSCPVLLDADKTVDARFDLPAAPQAPAVVTDPATALAPTTARLNGTVNPNGAATTYRFDYGTTTLYGSQTGPQDAGSGTIGVAVFADIGLLMPNTLYHYRLTATNPTGTNNGADRTFTTAMLGDPNPPADPNPPDTTIDSRPPELTNGNRPTFTFSSDRPGATFQCRVDADAYAACASPHTTAPLADGAHFFDVRAVTSGGADPSPARDEFTVDTVAPQTTITGGPPDGVRVDPSGAPPAYEFASSEAGSTFRCRTRFLGLAVISLVKGCASPSASEPSRQGAWQFEVAATDAAGNVDLTPATRTFDNLDRFPPETTITAGPADGGTAIAPPLGVGAKFRFVSSDAGARFECRTRQLPIDNLRKQTPFAACTSPHQPADLAIGKRYSFEVRSIDAAGNVDASPAERKFGYEARNVGKAYGNFRIRGIDVFQLVQPNASAMQYGFDPAGAFTAFAGGGTPTDWRLQPSLRAIDADPQQVPYEGVVLDPDHLTTAIVYASTDDVIAFDESKPLHVTLEMTSGTRVVFSDTREVAELQSSATPYVTASERDDPKYGIRFVIPRPRVVSPSQRFSLTATVAFKPGTVTLTTRECDGRDCSRDNRFKLRDVDVASGYGDLRFAALELYRTGKKGTLRSPFLVMERARHVLPNLLGTSPGHYRDGIDITDATNLPVTTRADGDFECGGMTWPKPDMASALLLCREAAVSAQVDTWSATYPGRVVSGDTITRNYDVVLAIHDSSNVRGWAQGDVTQVTRTEPRGVAPRMIINANGRPITMAAHELGHIMSADHAGQNCPGTMPGQAQVGEIWPPADDNMGRLQGTKFDSNRGGGLEVDGVADGKLFDLMSYCANGGDTDTADGNAWVSPYLWNRVTQRFIELGERIPRGSVSFPRAAAAAARAAAVTQVPAGAQKVALAIGSVNPAGGRIARVVAPDEDSITPAPVPDSPVRLRALAADGSVMAEAGVKIETASDRPEGLGTFVGPVPVAAATVELVRDGVVLDRLARTSAPAVKLLAPRARARARAGRDFTVRWSQSDPDGGRDRPQASVDYSADDGRTWRTVHLGPSTGSAVVPGSYLQGSARARIRVSVNDGFSETRVTSSRFRADGAPPTARILTPERREPLRADTRMVLTGEATDDTGAPLRGRSLTWFAGRRRLGSAEHLRTRLPGGRFTLRLVARDASGRTGTATLAVRVAATRVQLLDLRFSKGVKASARKLAVRVRTSAPARLRAAGRSHRVGPRSRTVVVSLPARPRAGVLRIPIRVVARGRAVGVVRGRIEVRRG